MVQSMTSALALISAAVLAAPGTSHAQGPSPDARADTLLKQMTQDEKFALLHGTFPRIMKPLPAVATPRLASLSFRSGMPRRA